MVGGCCMCGFCGRACALRWAVGSFGCVGAVARVRRFRPSGTLTVTLTFGFIAPCLRLSSSVCGMHSRASDARSCSLVPILPRNLHNSLSLSRSRGLALCVVARLGLYHASYAPPHPRAP